MAKVPKQYGGDLPYYLPSDIFNGGDASDTNDGPPVAPGVRRNATAGAALRPSDPSLPSNVPQTWTNVQTGQTYYGQVAANDPNKLIIGFSRGNEQNTTGIDINTGEKSEADPHPWLDAGKNALMIFGPSEGAAGLAGLFGGGGATAAESGGIVPQIAQTAEYPTLGGIPGLPAGGASAFSGASAVDPFAGALSAPADSIVSGATKGASKGLMGFLNSNPGLIALSAGMNLLGGALDNGGVNSFKGKGDADPVAQMQNIVKRGNEFADLTRAQRAAGVSLKDAYVQPTKPISVPGIPFTFGGGQGTDPAYLDRSRLDYMPPTLPEAVGPGQVESGGAFKPPVKRRSLS